MTDLEGDHTGGFDHDVIVIGSGFGFGIGGSVAAMRVAEKGDKTAVIEAGKRWPDSELPKTDRRIDKFVWERALELLPTSRGVGRPQRWSIARTSGAYPMPRIAGLVSRGPTRETFLDQRSYFGRVIV